MKIKLSDFVDIDLTKITRSTRKDHSYILGPSVQKFEQAFAEYTGAEACAATGNCTDSLRMCLQVLGIGPGSRVAVPSFTWLSTAEVVKQLYAQPVFVDVDDSLCMNTEDLLRVITSVDAVIYVNLFGNVAEIDAIKRIAGSVPVIEDNAQACGALYKGDPLGATGVISCYSFYPTKNLATLGDAGAVTGPDYFIEQIKQLRNHGQTNTKFRAEGVGWNSRMDSIHADILLHELKYLDDRNKRRREIAEQYNAELDFVKQRINQDCEPVWHQYALRTNKFTQLEDIQTRSYYNTPIHKLNTYNTGQQLPQTEYYSKNNICIPVHPYLKDSDVQYIIQEVKKCA